MEAFRGTGVFEHMSDPESIRTKFVLSSFVADFPLGSKLQEPSMRDLLCSKNKRHRPRKSREIEFLRSLGIRKTSTESFFQALAIQALAKQD